MTNDGIIATDLKSTIARTHLDRRTMLKAGAWAAPVIAVAAAVPAAAASESWDLGFAPAQSGSYGGSVFTDDFASRFQPLDPSRVSLTNTGTTAYLGTGAMISLTLDTRIWSVTGLIIGGVDHGAGTSTTSGSLETRTWPLIAPVPAGGEALIDAAINFEVDYPNDNVENPRDAVWQIDASDAGANNNWVVPNGTLEPATPFGAEIAATTTTRTLTFDGVGSSTYVVVETVTLTSVGPNAVPTGSFVRIVLQNDAAYDASIEEGQQALNGAATDIVSFVRADAVGDGTRHFSFAINAPLASGDVLTFTPTWSGGFPYPSTKGAGASFSPALSGDPDQRRTIVAVNFPPLTSP